MWHGFLTAEARRIGHHRAGFTLTELLLADADFGGDLGLRLAVEVQPGDLGPAVQDGDLAITTRHTSALLQVSGRRPGSPAVPAA
jgi:hypothetical protein